MDDQRPLPTIPIPPAQRWREFRLLYLPRLVFLLGIVGAALLWTRWIAPATLVAEAEVRQAEVRAPQAGVLTGLQVAIYQTVEANQVIGHIVVADPKLMEASLAVIRAEVGMLSASMAGVTDRQRVALEFERLRLDWMNARVEFAALRGRLQLAETDIARMEPLHRSGVMTEENFVQLKMQRDSLAAQVSEQSSLVSRLDPVLSAMAPNGDQPADLKIDSALAAAIKVQEAKLKLVEQQLQPVPLVAPMSGVVSVALRKVGETVVAGEPILRITSPRADVLSGYMRQPLPFEPKEGMPVEIRSRSRSRVRAESKIVKVSPAMETMTPTLVSALHLPPTPLPEPALKVQIQIPDQFTVRPGEFVDVVVR